MERLETRELAYFVALAEELHFGRAARRLGIAQPPLSRAIGRLERRIGVPLLDRSGRTLALTPAGRVLLAEGRKALDAVRAAGERARRAGAADPRLVVVMKPGGDAGLLPDILAAYAARQDALPVDVLVCGLAERSAALRDGRADLGLLHAPHTDLTGFDTADLVEEGQVAVLPRRHALAGRPAVCLADLRAEPVAWWRGIPRAAGVPGPEVVDAGQLMQLIALGRAVAVVPGSVRGHLRHDLVTVPVTDAPPSTVVLAWPEGSRSRAVAGFVRAATEIATAS
jgi:DNA-binding transcriptional LysR family regulator